MRAVACSQSHLLESTQPCQAFWLVPAWSCPVQMILFIQFQVSSYGGYLTYQAKSFGLPGDMVLLEKQPDVQLIVGIKAWPAQQEAGSSGHHWAVQNLD